MSPDIKKLESFRAQKRVTCDELKFGKVETKRNQTYWDLSGEKDILKQLKKQNGERSGVGEGLCGKFNCYYASTHPLVC